MTESQENSAQRFGNKYLTKHLVKYLCKLGLNPEELELLP